MRENPARFVWVSLFNGGVLINKTKQAPWPKCASELYRHSDRRLSAKLLPFFSDRGVSRSQRC
jgi:hypothetical protein